MSAITNALERILEWLKQNQNDKELQSGLSTREIDEKVAEGSMSPLHEAS